MQYRNEIWISAVLLLVCLPTHHTRSQSRVESQPSAAAGPKQTTRCDVSVPLHLEVVPLNQPAVGQAARFQIEVGNSLDPDLIRSSWIEYELPERVQRAGRNLQNRDILGKTTAGRAQLAVIVSDDQRYEIRARYVIQLTNGRTIARTAVREINIGDVPPPAVLGRIHDSGGNGIRVYRGATTRN